MRIGQNPFFPNYGNTSKQSETSADIPFVLGEDGQQAQTGFSEAVSDAPGSTNASANVSAALWQLSDPDGPSAPISSVEVSAEGTAKIQSMLGSSSQNLLDQFLALSHMTPAERIRAEYLREHNMTEDGLSQLPTDQRDAMNKEIAERIKEQLGIDGA